MKLNRHNLPVLPAIPKQPQRGGCPFNFEGNRVYAFIAVQAFQSERRTKGYVDGRKHAQSPSQDGRRQQELSQPNDSKSCLSDMW